MHPKGAGVAFTERELKRIDATVGELCRRMSPVQHADELRFSYEIDGHAVAIYEERPPWDGTEGEWTRLGVARFRFFRSRGEWLLYWMRRDLKWHLYEAVGPSRGLPRLLGYVEADRYGCFFG